jgi:hypothetical protein
MGDAQHVHTVVYQIHVFWRIPSTPRTVLVIGSPWKQ